MFFARKMRKNKGIAHKTSRYLIIQLIYYPPATGDRVRKAGNGKLFATILLVCDYYNELSVTFHSFAAILLRHHLI